MHRPVHLSIVAIALAACGSAATTGGDDAVDRMIMETCTAGSRVAVETEICRCALEELRSRYDAEAIIDLDRQLRDDPETVPDEVHEVVLACGFEAIAPATTQRPTTTTSTTTTAATSSSSTSTTRLP